MTEHDILSYIIPGFAFVMSSIGLAIFHQIREIRKAVQGLAVDVAVGAEQVKQHERRLKLIEKASF